MKLIKIYILFFLFFTTVYSQVVPKLEQLGNMQGTTFIHNVGQYSHTDDSKYKMPYKFILNYLDTAKQECGYFYFACKKNVKLQMVSPCCFKELWLDNIRSLIKFKHKINSIDEDDSLYKYYERAISQEKKVNIFDKKLKNKSKHLIYFYPVEPDFIIAVILTRNDSRSTKFEKNVRANQLMYFFFQLDDKNEIIKYNIGSYSIEF